MIEKFHIGVAALAGFVIGIGGMYTYTQVNPKTVATMEREIVTVESTASEQYDPLREELANKYLNRSEEFGNGSTLPEDAMESIALMRALEGELNLRGDTIAGQLIWWSWGGVESYLPAMATTYANAAGQTSVRLSEALVAQGFDQQYTADGPRGGIEHFQKESVRCMMHHTQDMYGEEPADTETIKFGCASNTDAASESASILGDIQHDTGIPFSAPEVVSFMWYTEDGGEVRVDGWRAESDRYYTDENEVNPEETLVSQGFEYNVYNMADGTTSGMTGLERGDLKCQVIYNSLAAPMYAYGETVEEGEIPVLSSAYRVLCGVVK